MDARIVIESFLYNPFLWLACAMGYWAMANAGAHKRRVMATVLLLLFLAMSSGTLRAQEREPTPQPQAPIMDPCSYLTPYSGMWWYMGCWL